MSRSAGIVLAGLCLAASPGAGQGTAGDSIWAGRFDAGKMWAFEYAPASYFAKTYGFTADSAWFARARMAALRIPGCSAAFVSPHGLVVTNHHCIRSRLTRIARPGEALLDEGFVARALDAERPIPGYYADQLIVARDVSAEIFAAVDRAPDDAGRDRARRDAMATVERRLRGAFAAGGDSIVVQVVALYHGGRYSAYVFRRFTDVRMVAAAELQMGYFGGDDDNFTYPRYALDFAFLRVYGPDGRPYATAHYFPVAEAGVGANEPVFVIGNPGPTSRLLTVAQLEFQRDVEVPALVADLEDGIAALEGFRAAHPAAAEAYDVRNRTFSLANRLKASRGRRAALGDAAILGRKAAAERQLRDAIAARPELQRQHGGVLDGIAALQRDKQRLAPEWRAFAQLEGAANPSPLLRRLVALHAWRAAPAESAGVRRARLRAIGTAPADLEARVLAARFAVFARELGDADPLTRAALGGRDAVAAAAALAAASVLADSARTAAAGDALPAGDPGAALLAALGPRYAAFRMAVDGIQAQERELASRLGRARFAVYGGSIPPDATSSPRITDGVVQGYTFNGTLAPWYTTFYGLYDRYSSFGAGTSWELPERWRRPPPGLDLATPLNFVSTADTYGGNSGSPAVLRDLSLVGINFDRNIEGLSRDFIYLPERGRNIMVSARAIVAALDHAYDLDRIARELQTLRLYETEAAADLEAARP